MSVRKLSPIKVVNSGLCIGCGSCAAALEGSIEFDTFGQLQAAGTKEWRRLPTSDLAEICPFSSSAFNEDELAAELFPDATQGRTAGRMRAAYVGYADEGGTRQRGSSGGMVSWMLEELLRRHLIDGVAHVVPVDPRTGRYFAYRISRTSEEIREGAKSRYYPVEMSQVLRQIADIPGRYAVVGVPCFIKAIQLLRKHDPVMRERIAFTLGLFCGHMKSAQFAESFARQMDVPLDQIEKVDFRIKDESRPASTYTAQFSTSDGSEHRRDWWNLLEGDWGAGFFQYSACNFCDDVIAETADISFGDAWVEPYSSDGRGTNVLVVRSPAVQELLEKALTEERICLQEVDEDFIVQTQAAGFRQRREGLAYRLTWPKDGLKPCKRVAPKTPESPRRRIIYRTRAHISKWSHRMYRASSLLKWAGLYCVWARSATAFYHGFAYSRGKFGRWVDRLLGEQGTPKA